MPCCEAVRVTRRAISPLLAMRMESRHVVLGCDVDNEALLRRRPATKEDRIATRKGLERGRMVARGILKGQSQEDAVYKTGSK